jgi:hypothetical protein
MNKRFYKKSIFHCISQFIISKIFQNRPPFVSMASHYFSCQKNHSTKRFNKYNESIIIWYGLWCRFLTFQMFNTCYGNSKPILHIHMMWSLHIIYYFIESSSHFIHLIFVPWPIIKLWQNYVVTHIMFSPYF